MIENLYQSFAAGDAETMSACYHPEATFDDPVFSLRGPEVGDMWRMFCRPGGDLQIQYSAVTADDRSGSAHWEARYRFPATGRPVHNVIEAEFEFADGLIKRHQDKFNFYRWSRQALGLSGVILGWTPLLRTRVRGQAAAQLSRFRRGRDQPPD